MGCKFPCLRKALAARQIEPSSLPQKIQCVKDWVATVPDREQGATPVQAFEQEESDAQDDSSGASRFDERRLSEAPDLIISSRPSSASSAGSRPLARGSPPPQPPRSPEEAMKPCAMEDALLGSLRQKPKDRKPRRSLTYIVEESSSEQRLVFLDVVLLGKSACYVADRATSAAEEISPEIYDAIARASIGSDASWVQASSLSSAGSDLSTLSGDAPFDSLSNLVGCIPDPESGVEARQVGRGSKGSEQKRRSSSKDRGKNQFRCYCHCGDVTARLAFYPVERLDDLLPDVRLAQMRSTAFIFLLPVNSMSLEAECVKHRQRLEEVRFNMRRSQCGLVDPNSPSGGGRDPRLACIALHTDNCESVEVSALNEPPSELGELKRSAPEIGVASIDDDVSLWSTLVCRTTEWLLSGSGLSPREDIT